MSNFSKLMASMQLNEAGVQAIHITEDWMQGRTTYGGLSAAICLTAIEKTFDDLPPLRSVQVSFIGPAGGDLEVKTEVLRRGRSVTYIQATVLSDGNIATHGVFCFGEPRASRLDHIFLENPELPDAAESEDFFRQGQGPGFTQHFDCRLAKGAVPMSGSDQHDHYIWARHKDSEATDIAALLGVADMPPPAVLPMFKEFAPISSMTWMINIIAEDISTTDGWWLMRSNAEHAQNGYSSQDMAIWNSDRELILTGKQNVAIFY